MKKIYSSCALLALAGLCGLVSWSCSSDDTGAPDQSVPAENVIAFDNETNKIESVVYTVDAEKVYTFYISPTAGLVDLEAMLLADDYLKIVTATPTGEIDLLASNNSLSYKNISVSPDAAEQIAEAALTLQLTSLNTAKMNLKVALNSGQTLRVQFHGTCIRYIEQAEGEKYDVKLDDAIFAYYMGLDDKNKANDGYYIALTNTGFQAMGTQFQLAGEGHALLLNFYGPHSEKYSNKNMPTGTFTESNLYEVQTFHSDYSGVLYRDAAGKNHMYTLLEPVVIERDANNHAVITAAYLDEDYNEHSIRYEGDFRLENATLGVYLPMIEEDVYIAGVSASGVYAGDQFQNGSGVVEVRIKDQASENNQQGYQMNITLFAEKFVDPERECRLIPGTYKVSEQDEHGKWIYAQGTWMPPVEVNYIGMIMPMGCFGMYDDGTRMGRFSYPASGEITVRQGSSKSNYTIEFDLTTIDNFKLQGFYSGDVIIENNSADDKDDGSSNLVSDYDLDLSHHTRAKCFPQTTIYDSALGWITLEKSWAYTEPHVEFGVQAIEIGTRNGQYEASAEYPTTGKLVETDVARFELIVPKGTDRQITPGVYHVSEERWSTIFRPGVCTKGKPGGQRVEYTYMLHSQSAIGNGYPTGYYDPTYICINGPLNVPVYGAYAAFQGGTVTIEKADGGDNWFTFTVECRDTRKHTIRGSWTGPVYLENSETPCTEASTTSPAAVSAPAAATSSFMENRPSFDAVKSQLTGTPRTNVSLRPIK